MGLLHKSFRHWTTVGAVRGAALSTSIHAVKGWLVRLFSPIVRLPLAYLAVTRVSVRPSVAGGFAFDRQGDYFFVRTRLH